MHRSTKLIRLGLFLIPWLPAFLLAIFVYAVYFPPPAFTGAYLQLHPDGTSTVVTVAQPAWYVRIFHRAPVLVKLVCALYAFLAGGAFLAGCALLFIGFFRRPKPPADPHSSL